MFDFTLKPSIAINPNALPLIRILMWITILITVVILTERENLMKCIWVSFELVARKSIHIITQPNFGQICAAPYTVEPLVNPCNQSILNRKLIFGWPPNTANNT